LSKKIAVIGIGNILRRDDGIGVVVLESLLKFYKCENIDYFNFAAASFDLLNKIKLYDAVLLIDGVSAGFAVGKLRICLLEDIDYHPDKFNSSTHEFNLKNFFELTRRLGIESKIYLAGIQVEDISFGEGLSNALAQKKDEIVKEIYCFIKERFLT
jgi:hydrogenase maturation protease